MHYIGLNSYYIIPLVISIFLLLLVIPYILIVFYDLINKQDYAKIEILWYFSFI